MEEDPVPLISLLTCKLFSFGKNIIVLAFRWKVTFKKNFFTCLRQEKFRSSMAAQAFDSSIWETEAGRLGNWGESALSVVLETRFPFWPGFTGAD